MYSERLLPWKRLLVMFTMLGYSDVFQNKAVGQDNLCDGGCCAGYTWNEELQRCEKCEVGYYGVDCDKPCVYPYYGENCDGECFCPQEHCNITVGCYGLNYQKGFSQLQGNGTTRRNFHTAYSQPQDNVTTHLTTMKLRISSERTLRINHFHQISHESFIIFTSMVCVGVFIIVAVVVSVGYVLHKRSLRRFEPATSSCDANINSMSLKCGHENSDKLFAGDAKLAIFFNKDRNTYHVEICTDQRVNSTENQYLTADETRRVEEPLKVYESIQEDLKLTLRTLRPNTKNDVPDSSETSSWSGSECDTTVKEVARSTDTDQCGKQTDKNVYLTVY